VQRTDRVNPGPSRVTSTVSTALRSGYISMLDTPSRIWVCCMAYTQRRVLRFREKPKPNGPISAGFTSTTVACSIAWVGLDDIFEPEPTERCLARAGRLMTYCLPGSSMPRILSRIPVHE
jgi:hypothetical protein